jgi:hypothetical protein
MAERSSAVGGYPKLNFNSDPGVDGVEMSLNCLLIFVKNKQRIVDLQGKSRAG